MYKMLKSKKSRSAITKHPCGKRAENASSLGKRGVKSHVVPEKGEKRETRAKRELWGEVRGVNRGSLGGQTAKRAQ